MGASCSSSSLSVPSRLLALGLGQIPEGRPGAGGRTVPGEVGGEAGEAPLGLVEQPAVRPRGQQRA